MVDRAKQITVLTIGSVHCAYGLLRDRWRVSTAGRGESAIQRVRECQPDLVLLGSLTSDVARGVSPPGYEMVRRLKADPTTRTLRVVMLTSLQKPEHRRKVEQAGVDAYIVIPVDSAELETMLQELMQRPPRTL